jgi:hypothetical protein
MIRPLYFTIEARIYWLDASAATRVQQEAGKQQLARVLRSTGNGANEIFEVSANGGRARFTRNVGNIVMDVNDELLG